MLHDNIYEKIDQYVNNELTDKVRKDFEKSIENDKEIAENVKLYQDVPNKLKNIKADLDFNQKLQEAALKHRASKQGNTTKKNWTILVIGGAIVFLGVLVAMQFFNKSTTPTIDENIPMATLWEQTDMPSANIIRGNQVVDTDLETYQKAHLEYQDNDYLKAIEILTNITTTSDIYQNRLLLEGVCQYELGNFDQAIKSYQSYLELPNVIEDLAIWYQAIAFIQNKETDKAQKNLQIIIDENYSKTPEARKLLKQLK